MRHQHRIVSALLALVLLTVSLGAMSVSPVAQEPLSLPQGEGPWVVRAYYTDRQMVNDLAAWLEPWEVHHDRGYLVVGVGPVEYRRMVDMGFRLEVDKKLTAELRRPHVNLPGQTAGIPGYPCYRTVEETFATAENIVANYPTLATWTDVGDSWEKIQNPNNGYDMMVLRLTNSAIPGPKPKLFIMTSVHAREYAPAELNTRFAEYLVENYGRDPDVTWLLDYTEIHLMLQANPDGRKVAEQGYYQRKNTNDTNGGTCSVPPTMYNQYGTDLNRNYEFQWGCCSGSSTDPCAQTYRGSSAASEPETRAVQDYVRAQFPDQRGPNPSDPAPEDAMGVFLDIHSYSQLVLWPWGYTYTGAPNGTALQTLGRKFAYFNGYEPDQSVGLYPTDGTTDDFAYGDLGLAAYTFELGTAFFQDCATFENTILPDNLPALIYAAKVSRTPYMTPAGPDSVGVAIESAGVVSGMPVTLTATINDTRYNNSNGTEPTQNIAAAEYYVDTPPWDTNGTPVAHPMTPVDGSFDAKTEDVQAVVDTTGLDIGRHIIFVRGQDADGNWGAPSAVFMHVLDPALNPVIEGYVLEAGTSNPLTATVAAGNFQARTDATGYYSMTVISGTYDMQASASDHLTVTASGILARDGETVRQDFALLVTCRVLTDDMESGTARWDHRAAQGSDQWTLSTVQSHSPSHAWFVPDAGSVTDSFLWTVSPVTVGVSSTLTFWHRHQFEGSSWDGAVLEITTDGGATWTDLGPYIVLNGYNGTLSADYGNPLGGRDAWTGDLWTWKRVMVDLSTFAGKSIQVRWRIGCDSSQDDVGWYIDDVVVTNVGAACNPAPGRWRIYLPLVRREG